MKLQVLVSAMNQTDLSLVKNMNIQSDCIIINQCNRNEVKNFKYKNNNIQILSFDERGIGLSRNNAIMRATSEICIFSDEDVSYVDNYEAIIINAFEKNPNADIILFNVLSKNKKRPTYVIEKNKRVRWYNCLRYGAVKIAVKVDKLRQANVFFSLLFGGGAKYSSGEDSLFLAECIRKGLKVYTNKEIIGYVAQEESTWFNGYTEKYFIDKGVFYATLNKKIARLLCLQYAIRHKNTFINEKSIYEVLKLMNMGVKLIR